MSSFRNALALYLLWVAATYLLEGLPRTLHRPEATGLRLAYALLANLGIGMALALWLIRRHLRAGWGSATDFGFSAPARRWASIAGAALLGYGLFRLSRPQPVDAEVFLRLFAQVWVVSAAEVVVCWSLVGTALRHALGPRRRATAVLAAAAASSLLFGAYHFAHSPPFDELRMVAFLTMIGLATSAWWLLSRELLGTVVFHNFFAVTGVLAALQGKAPAGPAILPLATALLAAGVLAWPAFRWGKRG